MSSGIVAKVWNIKGESITKGAKEQISDSISYILNDEKTEIKLDINTLDQLTRECKYVENDLKTFSGAYVGVHNVISSDIATAVGEMMNVKKFFGKTSGRAALHMMISLPEEESDVANAPRLMQLCQDVLKELFPDNQAIFAVHTNTDNLHIHIIVNSVGLNGKKIHQDNKYIKERLQPCVNKYAKWYNFTPNSEWSKKKSASAYPYVQLKMELRDAIDMAIEKADTFESFLNNLQEQGITARIGKHISLKIPGMSKAVRTHNLGPNYTRDAIVERIISKKEKLTLQTKEEYFALIKPDNVFEPVLFQMKKYKEMSDVEKKEVIHELKLGKNPWRENREMNWQLNKIANELNQFERIRSYVDYYSDSGTLQDALDGIISAKKQIEHDKKMVSYAKKKYRPIIKIYDEMKEIEKRAYLYEHQNVTEYRSEFEQYRKLTRRLKDNYGKEIFEVADFIAECDERLLYAHAQLNELSTQYRELKQYALQRGMRLDIKDNFEDIIGIYNRKDKTIEMDSFYVASTGTDVVFKIIKTLGTDENGKNYQMFNISVMDSTGNIIEHISNKGNDRNFNDAIKQIKEKYEVASCKRFEQYAIAKSYSAVEDKKIFNNSQSQEKASYSFAQAINHVYDERKQNVIIDSKTPSATYLMSMSGDLSSVIADVEDLAPQTEIHFTSFGTDLIAFAKEYLEIAMTKLLFFIASIVTLGIIVASCISILSSAFQRILKPLAILPFSSITVALASGTHEAERVTTSYIETFFGFCISGAFMVICVKLGTALTNGGLIAFDFANLSTNEKLLYISVQNMITPIVIAGLVKTADSVIGRFL